MAGGTNAVFAARCEANMIDDIIVKIHDLGLELVTIHDQSGEDEADLGKRGCINEHLHDQRSRKRQYRDEKSEKDLAGKLLTTLESPDKIENKDCDQWKHHKRIQRAALILVFRRHIKDTHRHYRDGERAGCRIYGESLCGCIPA